jgi:cytidylate kinase
MPENYFMNKHPKITIAIDGHSSCGKSTLAKALAEKLNYVFIDTGAMYRAVALFGLKKGIISATTIQTETLIQHLNKIELHFELNATSRRPEIYLNGENCEQEIRTIEISQLVSKVAAIKEVRSKLVEEQRKMGIQGGIVMDGRDIGSVVFPNAELKLFVTADVKVRAERRFKELIVSNPTITLSEIQKNLEERDFLDSNREESPLIQTKDSILLDTSKLTPNDQLTVALELVNTLLKK